MNPFVILGGAFLLISLLFDGSTDSTHKTHPGLPDLPSPPPPPPPPPPAPPPRPQGLTFATRNAQAIQAIVNALLADPLLTTATLNIYADQFALYGFEEEAAALRKKATIAPKYTQQQIQSGVAKLWETQAKQGFW